MFANPRSSSYPIFLTRLGEPRSRPNPHLKLIYNSALKIVHLPDSSKRAKVVIIPKPGRDPKFSQSTSWIAGWELYWRNSWLLRTRKDLCPTALQLTAFRNKTKQFLFRSKSCFTTRHMIFNESSDDLVKILNSLLAHSTWSWTSGSTY